LAELDSESREKSKGLCNLLLERFVNAKAAANESFSAVSRSLSDARSTGLEPALGMQQRSWLTSCSMKRVFAGEAD
jgi:hypothetical protein